MIHAKACSWFVDDAEEQWKWVLYQPPYRFRRIESPRGHGALDLNREVVPWPCQGSDSFGHSAVEINAGVFLMRYGNGSTEGSEDVLRKVLRSGAFVEVRS